MKKRTLLILTLLFTIIGLVACKQDSNRDYNFSKEFPKNDIYYQIFVRSFADSDGDGIGDLNGITNKLDYLEDLGITAIWLTPIHPTDSYHGYEVVDYYAINPEFGTMDDFENLLKEAKDKNIKVIMDAVFNHSSPNNLWYQDSLNDLTSPYREFYIWSSNEPGKTGHESFPNSRDLNLKSEALKQELVRVLEFYLEKGVAGFRFDAVRHYFNKPYNQNYSSQPDFEGGMVLRYLKQEISKNYPDAYFIGEYFEYSINSYEDFYLGADSMFNFEISRFFQQRRYSNLQLSLNRIYESLDNFNPNAIDAPFITNHDLDRFASMVDTEEDIKQAAKILLTLPGNPFIYYGDEIGMKGRRLEGGNVLGYEDQNGNPITVYDEPRRQPFLWGTEDSAMTTWFPLIDGNDEVKIASAQQKDKDSLYNTYKEMIQIRKDNPALFYGNKITRINSIPGSIAFIREIELDNFKQYILVVHNITSATKEIEFDVIREIYGSKTLEPQQTYIAEISSNVIE